MKFPRLTAKKALLILAAFPVVGVGLLALTVAIVSTVDPEGWAKSMANVEAEALTKTQEALEEDLIKPESVEKDIQTKVVVPEESAQKYEASQPISNNQTEPVSAPKANTQVTEEEITASFVYSYIPLVISFADNTGYSEESKEIIYALDNNPQVGALDLSCEAIRQQIDLKATTYSIAKQLRNYTPVYADIDYIQAGAALIGGATSNLSICEPVWKIQQESGN